MSRSAPVLSHIPFLPTVTHIHPHPRRPILPASGETVDVLLTLFLDFPCPSPLARRMGNTSAGPLPPSICHAGGRRAPYSVPPCASQLAWMHPHSTVLPLTVACCPLVAQEEPPWLDDSHLLLRSLPETQGVWPLVPCCRLTIKFRGDKEVSAW